MKSFNIFLVISLVAIAGGFIFFKDGFIQSQTAESVPSLSHPEMAINRLNYIDYSPQNLQTAYDAGSPLLFFAATLWCQSCAGLDKEIQERSQELPSNVTILKVDYDKDKVTTNQHNVTVQHTLVQLDRNGKEIQRWIGGDFDALLLKLQ